MQYTINAIDEDGAKKWTNPKDGNIVYYITVGLEGHDKPVSIGKKSPDALKVGDTVYGTILPTDYLTDKWKGEAPQSGSGNSKSDKPFQKDVTDMPDRWMGRLLPYFDAQNLVKDGKISEHGRKFIETAQVLAEESLLLVDNVRNTSSAGSAPSGDGSTTQPKIKENLPSASHLESDER